MNPHITAAVVAVNEYPDLIQRYRVTGVPKTIVNGTIEILGALPEAAFVSQVVSAAA